MLDYPDGKADTSTVNWYYPPNQGWPDLPGLSDNHTMSMKSKVTTESVSVGENVLQAACSWLPTTTALRSVDGPKTVTKPG